VLTLTLPRIFSTSHQNANTNILSPNSDESHGVLLAKGKGAQTKTARKP